MWGNAGCERMRAPSLTNPRRGPWWREARPEAQFTSRFRTVGSKSPAHLYETVTATKRPVGAKAMLSGESLDGNRTAGRRSQLVAVGFMYI